MRLTRCPICHGRISLEALVQDEAGRELLALVARLDTQTGAALVSYLGLFRSASRDLANERALKLARETLALVGRDAGGRAASGTKADACMDAGGRAASGTKAEVAAPDTARLAIALSETVEALRGKPRQPLKNHNYLKKVFESVQARPVIASTEHSVAAPRSKAGQAYMTLEHLKRG